MEEKVLNNDYEVISPEMFEFTQINTEIHDAKFKTKAVGYFGDAFRRFCKNKSSVVAFFILVLIILLTIIAPVVSKYDSTTQSHSEMMLPPRIPLIEHLGIFDGTRQYDDINVDFVISLTDPKLENVTESEYNNYFFFEYITKIGSKNVKNKSIDEKAQILEEMKYEYTFKDVLYYHVDFKYDEYARSQAPRWITGQTHAQYLEHKQAGTIVLDSDGNEMISIDKTGAKYYEKNPSKLPANRKLEDYYVYKIYVNLAVSGDEIYHYFGTDHVGRDLWTRLWEGSRLSLLIGLFVAVVSLSVGTIWGSISGYYGGIVDLLMERFTEVLGGIPWIVIMILVKMLLTGKVPDTVLVAISLILTSWIGTASMVRSQMYRYKNREYVLASRTLGANDARLITKHILPNALGTIVTSSILVIPSAIFFESSVAYLGLGVNSSTISIGNLLSLGREMGIVDNPYLTLAPAIYVSVLMIAFNMFGNGLRDALNPSLRGSE